jgi:tetratricopeptide (TPR) repeat protein
MNTGEAPQRANQLCQAAISGGLQTGDLLSVMFGRLFLGMAYLLQGRSEEGFALVRQASQQMKNDPGVSIDSLLADELRQSNTRITTALLGILLETEGRHMDLERLNRHALAIEERTLGSDHPNVSARLMNIATNISQQGRHQEATVLLERSLSIVEKSLGPSHEQVLRVMKSLALEYDQSSLPIEAERLLRKILSLREAKYGSEHALVGESLQDLGFFLRYHGRANEAFPLLRRALSILERVNGLESPEVAAALDKLAGFYVAMGQYADAIALLMRSLGIREKAFGSESAPVAEALTQIASVKEKLAASPSQEAHKNAGNEVSGRPTKSSPLDREQVEAEMLLRRAISIRVKEFGSQHAKVASALHDLGRNLIEQKRFREADEVLQRSLGIYEQTLGRVLN